VFIAKNEKDLQISSHTLADIRTNSDTVVTTYSTPLFLWSGIQATGEPELQPLVIAIHRFKKWMVAVVRSLWRQGCAVNCS
jgi:hypothetical protein